MLTPIQIDSLINEFISESWINPFSEFNRGYRLEPSYNRASRRGAKVFDLSVKLPGDLDFGIYLLPVGSITWIGDTRVLQEWKTLTEYCNLSGTLLSVTNPMTGDSLHPKDCHIALVQGRYPVLITPYVPGAVDVNIRKSFDPNRLTVVDFQIDDIYDPSRIELSLPNPLNTYRIYADGKYYLANSLSDLPVPSSGWLVHDPALRYVVEAGISGLPKYHTEDGAFYAIELGVEDKKIAHYIDCEFHLTHQDVGVIVDKTSGIENLHQLTNKVIGVRANYVEILASIAGLPMSQVKVVIHVQNPGKEYLGNDNYNALIENLDRISATDLVTNGDSRLAFVYGDALSKSTYNKLQMSDIINREINGTNFDPWELDNRINAKRSTIPDERIEKYTMSGKDFSRYSQPLKYAVGTVDISSYIFPRIYTRTHEDAEFGTDYYLSGDGILTLLNDAYVVEHCGRYEVEIDRPFEIIELNSNPIFSHPKVKIEIRADGNFLHPGVDYGFVNDGLIVWKAGVTKFILAAYITNYSYQYTTWVTDERVWLDTPDFLAYGPRINTFIGNECVDNAPIMPATNGLPCTIEYELLDLFDKNTNMDAINNLRKNYDDNVDMLRSYYEPHDKDLPPSAFNAFYELVSPMCGEVLTAIRNGEMPYTPNDIFELGIEGCIPKEIMDRFYQNYDPSTSNNLNGKQFIEIKAHDEGGMVELNPDEWNFIRHLTSTLLQGRIIMEQFYRIVYE